MMSKKDKKPSLSVADLARQAELQNGKTTGPQADEVVVAETKTDNLEVSTVSEPAIDESSISDDITDSDASIIESMLWPAALLDDTCFVDRAANKVYRVKIPKVNIPGIGVRTALEVCADPEAQAWLIANNCVGSVLEELL